MWMVCRAGKGKKGAAVTPVAAADVPAAAGNPVEAARLTKEVEIQVSCLRIVYVIHSSLVL